VKATASSRRYHVSGEPLLQLGSAVQLGIGPPGQACGAQSQQPLQAADQTLVVALQLHADRELLAARENATKRTVQLPLQAEEESAGLDVELNPPPTPPPGYVMVSSRWERTCSREACWAREGGR